MPYAKLVNMFLGMPIGRAACLGIGATVSKRIHIRARIGAGAVVVDSIPECVLVHGVPAKVIRKMAMGEN